MSKNKIYYFSGTGNSLNAAIEIAKALSNTEIISMRCNPRDVSADTAEVIGFIFPVYHWSLPEQAKVFIQELAINHNAYIFSIATCGGWPVNALNDLSSLIKKKGAKVSYSAVHKCVANYVAEYEPFPAPTEQLPKSEIELKVIVKEIASMAFNKSPRNTLLKEILRTIEKPFVRSLPQKDRHFVISENCISCGLCERICIAHNIEMKNGVPSFKHQCAQCMGCVAYCPKGAINYLNKTQKRTKYHHPNITGSQISKDMLFFE